MSNELVNANVVNIEALPESAERVGEGADPKLAWEATVREACRDLCANCGSTDHLRVCAIVPEHSGGALIPANGTLLCRSCNMAFDGARSGRQGDKRSFNFWCSQELNDRLNNGLKSRNGFTSIGGMVRYLMDCYVEDPARFDDLEQYQDDRVAELKLNVWVDSSNYDAFKSLVNSQGKTVTETLRSLIRMYECGVDRLMKNKHNAEGH